MSGKTMLGVLKLPSAKKKSVYHRQPRCCVRLPNGQPLPRDNALAYQEIHRLKGERPVDLENLALTEQL